MRYEPEYGPYLSTGYTHVGIYNLIYRNGIQIYTQSEIPNTFPLPPPISGLECLLADISTTYHHVWVESLPLPTYKSEGQCKSFVWIMFSRNISAVAFSTHNAAMKRLDNMWSCTVAGYVTSHNRSRFTLRCHFVTMYSAAMLSPHVVA